MHGTANKHCLIAGMRRSGTTIVFDLLAEDGRYALHYEPLAAARARAIGSGSRSRAEDYFDALRQARARFLLARPEADAADLNIGGPRSPALEFAADLSPLAIDYLRALHRQHPQPSAYKFCRLGWKLGQTGQWMDEAAALLHIVRDPRCVATSFLLGKGRKNRDHFASDRDFFGRRTIAEGRRLVQGVANIFYARNLAPPDASDVEILLALWGATCRAHLAGLDALPSHIKGSTMTYESLIFGDAGLDRLRAELGIALDSRADRWLSTHRRPGDVCWSPDSDAWLAAIERTGIADLLEKFGYPERPRANHPQ